MIPLKTEHYKIKGIRYTVLDDNSCKFLITYWYGRTKVLYDLFLIKKKKKAFLKYIKSYEIFIRSLYASGFKDNELKYFINDFLNRTFDFLSEKDVLTFKNEFLKVTLLDIFILFHIYGSSELNEKVKLIQQKIINNIAFEDKEIETWYRIMLKEDNLSNSKISDPLLINLINNDYLKFEKHLSNYIERAKQRGLRGWENNRNSDAFLAKSIGFYDYSFEILKEGYLNLYKKYNY